MSGRYSFWCPDNAHARHLAGVTDSDKDFLRETKRVENPLERMAAKAAAAPARKWTPPAGSEPTQPLIPARPPDSARRRPATARARSCASERAGAEEGNVDDERSERKAWNNAYSNVAANGSEAAARRARLRLAWSREYGDRLRTEARECGEKDARAGDRPRTPPLAEGATDRAQQAEWPRQLQPTQRPRSRGRLHLGRPGSARARPARSWR